ncbi:UvrD-helicase domain-containing protein [Ferruginibacter sp.]
MNHKQFISVDKSMLIAPAGHGKTHSITECLLHTEGKQLILTHTHAGVASINEKIKKNKLSPQKYHVETIAGYAQKYVQAYCKKASVPDRDNTDIYYSFILEKAKSIIASPIISHSIKTTYTGLFVDEYQDCTIKQHELIQVLAKLLPTRILGDPLQGIFNFGGSIPMVDLGDAAQMGGFLSNSHKLEEPWRWKGINEPLGDALKKIRADIELKNPIDLSAYPSVEYIKISSSSDLYNPTLPYYKSLNKLLSNRNLLIIHPESSSIHPRKKIIASFKIPIILIESIDDKDFYKLSKIFDDVASSTIGNAIYEVSLSLFNKVEVNKWLNNSGAKRRTGEWKSTSDALRKMFADATVSNNFSDYANLLEFINQIKGIRCFRKELLRSLCSTLRASSTSTLTVSESMIETRNHVRKIGKKVFGRCIGTTLLTKGLEFETVVILNAHDFECPKNLYVALTRASKRLIVFSTSAILSPKY